MCSEISNCFKEIQFLGVGLQEYSNVLGGGDNVGHLAHGGGSAFGVAFTVMFCIQGGWGDRRRRLVGDRVVEQ